jgi:hypothetical protein
MEQASWELFDFILSAEKRGVNSEYALELEERLLLWALS